MYGHHSGLEISTFRDLRDLRVFRVCMKIIGTGLSGLVGSRIVEVLSSKYRFIDWSLEKGIDITDFSQLKSAFNKNKDAKFLLHLAAFTDVDVAHKQNNDKNSLCYQINVVGTKNLVKLCEAYKIHFIHTSTDFIFSGKDGKKQSPYTEKDKPDPIEWYGKTKLLAEKQVQKANCSWTILRLAFPFKAKPSKTERRPPKLDLVRKIKVRLEYGQRVKVFTDQLITPTFIDDFTQIVEKVIEKKAAGIFNSVGSFFVSPFELAQKIAQTFDLPEKLIKPASLEKFLKTANRPRQQFMALSNKKVKKELQVFPKDIEKALKEIKAQLQ